MVATVYGAIATLITPFTCTLAESCSIPVCVEVEISLPVFGGEALCG